MGNSQSHVTSQKRGRRPNRLSKPPTNLTFDLPRSAALDPKDEEFANTPPYRNRSPWLSSHTDSSPAVQKLSPGQDVSMKCCPQSATLQKNRREQDLQVVPDEQPPGFSTRESKLIRRQSAPERAFNTHRLSLDVPCALGEEPAVPTPAIDRRVTIQDTSELAAGLSLKLNGSLENQGDKRYSASRRRSLRTPGVATRGSEKPSPLTPPPKQPDSCNGVYETQPKNPLNGVSWLNLDSPTNKGGGEIPSLRASTPNDFEYSYLGPFKPGSLHVVNGRASPASSGRKSRSLTEAKAHGTYRGAAFNGYPHDARQQNGLQGLPLSVQCPYANSNTVSNVERGKTFDDPNHHIYGMPELGPSPYTRHASFTDNRKSSPIRYEMDGKTDVAPPSFDPSKDASSHLIVTSKKTALEDDLSDEDEAVDASMPENAVTAKESDLGGTYRLATYDAPTIHVPDVSDSHDHPSRTSHGNANDLSKSDSGYSSTSSKTSSQPVCGYFCRNQDGSGCATSNDMTCIPIDGNPKEYPNSQSFGCSWPVSSAIHEEEFELPTNGMAPLSMESHGDSSFEPVYPNYASRTHNRHNHRQYADTEAPICQTHSQNCSLERQPQPTYHPKPWPLRNDITAQDDQVPNPTESLQDTAARIWARNNNTHPASRRRSARATLSKPLPFIQLEDLQEDPASRRPSSAGPPAPPSQCHDSSSGKYITRIKSLVSLRARRQQQRQQQHEQLQQSCQGIVHPTFPTNDGQPQQEEDLYERKRRRNKLKRKSSTFNYVGAVA